MPRELAVPVAYALAHPGPLSTQLGVPGGSALQVRVPFLASLRCPAKVPLRWWCVHGSPFDFAMPMNSLQRYLCFSACSGTDRGVTLSTRGYAPVVCYRSAAGTRPVSALGHRFYRDYAPVLRAVLFAVGRHRAHQVTSPGRRRLAIVQR